jgi:hypothetical protein
LTGVRPCLLFALIFSLLPVAFAQTHAKNNLYDARRIAKHNIPLPFSLLVPRGIREGYDVRAFIASPEFGVFDSTNRPEVVFDEIYFTAVEYAHGNISDALLAASFGSFEHEYIPVAFFGSEIHVPLTGESHARFVTRQSHLPEHLYHTSEDDRDKLQHFFASGWLKESLGMDWLAKLAGKMVEVGENMFLVGGFEDPRDLHANEDGIHFAAGAGYIFRRPSEALTPNPQP